CLAIDQIAQTGLSSLPLIYYLEQLFRCQAAISSVIALSQALKMELVIEGIETNSQLTLLQQLGCTVGQGYCFSRPIDEQTFVQRFFPISIESDNFIRLNSDV
ncbi:EAL domain-containing protein, partial [Shewanella oneidensis]|uniref:EAL domain-containing protein n=1 Tax=Shewanella oneidensis TaxID=70863 RepID=UPI002E7BD1BD